MKWFPKFCSKCWRIPGSVKIKRNTVLKWETINSFMMEVPILWKPVQWFAFYTPWKCQKTFGFLTFLGGIESKSIDWFLYDRDLLHERVSFSLLDNDFPIALFLTPHPPSFSQKIQKWNIGFKWINRQENVRWTSQ